MGVSVIIFWNRLIFSIRAFHYPTSVKTQQTRLSYDRVVITPASPTCDRLKCYEISITAYPEDNEIRPSACIKYSNKTIERENLTMSERGQGHLGAVLHLRVTFPLFLHLLMSRATARDNNCPSADEDRIRSLLSG